MHLIRNYSALIVLALLSLVASLVGVGGSYQTILPGDSRFPGYGTDLWISDGATLSLPALAGIAHYVNFEVTPSRPEELGPAHLKMQLCDGEVESASIMQEQTSFKIQLPTNCHSVKFQVENPFLPGGQDDRLLAVRVSRITAGSSFKLPVLRPGIYAHWSVLIFIASGLICFLIRSVFLRVIVTFAFPSGVSWLLIEAGSYRWPQLENLLFVTIAVSLGIVLAPLAGESLERRIPLRRSRDGAFCLVVLAIILGGALRFYALDWGFPLMLHPDSVRKVRLIERMVVKHTLEPQNFLHPSLLLYLSYGVSKILNLLNIESGSLQILFAGRLVSAFAGTLSIPILFLLGERLIGRFASAYSALLFALIPLHITCSRYFKEDALLICCVLAALLFVVRAMQDGRVRDLLFGGFLVGVSIGAKYTGFLLLPVLLLLPMLPRRFTGLGRTIAVYLPLALLFVVVGFLVTTPYAILSYDKFLEGVQTEQAHLMTGHDVKISAWSQLWMFHLMHSVYPGMTIPVTIASIVGLGILLGKKSYESLLVVFLVMLFFLPAEYANSKPAPQAERYILGAIPFLCLAAGSFIALFVAQRRFVTGSICALLILIVPGYRSGCLAWELEPDTRKTMIAWMLQSLPADTSILIESRYAPRLRNSTFRTQLLGPRSYRESLKIKKLESSGFDYLLVTSLSYDRYFREPSADRLIRGRFRTVFETLPLAKEISPAFGSYGFHNPTVRLYALSPRAQEKLGSLP